MAKKINLDEIDESFIIAAVKKDKSSVPENPERLLQPSQVKTVEMAEQSDKTIEETEQTGVIPSEQSKEESKRKRKTQDYESLFIRESGITARFGKSVYIRKEYHDRISQIISVIGSNEVSLFGYIDNVLTHHFEKFGDDIIQSFKKNIIFK
jgi:hypothetical protein